LALRFAAIPALAAAIVGAAVLSPHSMTVAPAFASWSATPTTLAGERLAAATAACLTTGKDHTTWSYADQWDPGEPIIAEQRGEWAALRFDNGLLPSEPGAQGGTCLVLFVDNHPRVVNLLAEFTDSSGSNQSLSTSGSGTYGLDDDLRIGSTSNTLFWIDSGLPPSESLSTLMALEATLGNEGSYSVLRGRVGSDVVGMVIHSPFDGDIEATVADGQFLAWWPESAMAGNSQDGNSLTSAESTKESEQISASGLERFVTSITVTLSDGTQRELNPPRS